LGREENILGKVRSQYRASVRIGISEEHRQPAELLKAYQEACAALDESGSSVSFYSDPVPQKAQVADVMARLLKAFRQGSSVTTALRDFLRWRCQRIIQRARFSSARHAHVGYRAHGA
jgi:Asp-tRNA(Asn)/Glu-tRNA(Gln) amidotransferase A subunit family amidase